MTSKRRCRKCAGFVLAAREEAKKANIYMAETMNLKALLDKATRESAEWKARFDVLFYAGGKDTPHT